MDKTKEFTLKLASQLSFIKENGKYYIKCDYPEIPEGYEWSLGIKIFNKDGSYIGYNPITRVPDCQIPREGSFKKEATYIRDANNIEGYVIVISVDHKEMDNTGILEIVYKLDGSKKRVEFIPYTSLYPQEKYTNNFNFSKMFQW